MYRIARYRVKCPICIYIFFYRFLLYDSLLLYRCAYISIYRNNGTVRDLEVVQSCAPGRFNIRGIEGALGHSPMLRYQPINPNPAQIVLSILSRSNETAVFALQLGHGLRF